MRILVTGAAGFIGSHISETLLARGDEVIGVDNFCDYYDPLIKENNISDFENNKYFRLYRADIDSYPVMNHIFNKEKPQKVIHLAARAGVRASIQEPLLFSQVNNVGTSNLLELSHQHGVENFVFSSSSSVYGNNEKIPFAEEDNVDYPISPYAATKKAGELLCHVYSHLHDLPCTCLRLFTVYGPKGRPDMAPYKFVKAVFEEQKLTKYGDGTMRRDYTFVDDITKGIISALDHEYKFEIINLGNSDPVELNDFIAIVESLVGKKAKIETLPVPPGDVKVTYADINKAKKLLDYQPTTSFDAGMDKFVSWFGSKAV
ncbi:GDP-mannose 4,6-dehydratase [Patescibacteria group bacterium]|nr:GDP-mannose 4,6-dehydratase [Patescibacteria group bacterium]